MKARLILVETFVDGRQNLLMLTPNIVINAQTHATYTIIDAQTRKTPVDLVLHRQGDALQVMMGDEAIVTLEGFYNEALASQYISANEVLLISDDVLINVTETSLAGLSSGDAFPAYYDTLVAMTMYGITAAGVYEYEKNLNDEEVTIIPPSTTINAIGISADTGVSTADYITNTAAQTITATLSAVLETGEILNGSIDGGITWIDITSKVSGTAISWDGVILSGSSSIQIKVTDSGGHDGVVASQAYVLDMIAPVVTVSGIDISADTGTSATDFLTKTAAQTITATLSAALTVDEVLYGSVDGGITWVDISDKVSGTAISWNTATLSGSSSIQFKVSDLAGNDGAIESQAYILDSVGPATTIGAIDISDDTGKLITDFITNTAAQTITGTLSTTLVAGEILYGSLDDGVSWVDITGKASGTAITWDGITLSGSSSIKMKVTDDVGNDGAVASQAYVLDTIAPSTSVSGIDISTDTGTSATDFLTATSAQTITATLSAALITGELLYGSLDGGSTWIDITNKVSGTAINWTGAVLSGSNTLQIKVSDLAGNDGSTTSQAYVLDIAPPATTITSVDISADTGTSATDFLTKTSAQTITGTLSAALVAGEVLYGSVNGGATWLDITSKASGTAISWNGVTLSGSSSIQIKVMDAAGNDGAITSQAYVMDTTSPTNIISNIDISVDTGKLATDFITNTDAQTITATLNTALVAGDVLWGSVDGGSTWTDITLKASGTAITWNGATLSVGSNSIKMKVTDAAGNDGAVATQTYDLDATAPLATVSAIDISADTGTSATDFLTKTTSQTITATLSTALVAGDVLWGSVNGGGTWVDITSKASGTAISWNGATLSGSNTIQIKVSDVAGNDSSTASQAYVVDTLAPATTINTIDISDDTGRLTTDFITKTASQTITATLSSALVAGEILYGSVNGGSSWVDITTKASGTAVSWDGATLSGTSTVKFKVTDAAGNDGTIATTQTYVLDTVVPATTITSAAYSAGTNTITLTGTNMLALLSAIENPVTTDLKSSIDWTKLQWDIDSDNTGNIVFSEADITSAIATNNTTLTIVLGGTKAAALETSPGFDPLTVNDSLEITTGFTSDTAGNVSTTDRLNTPDPTVVVFDLVAGQSSSHSGRTFDAGISYDIYIMVDSNSRALVSATQWSGVSSLGTDDNITLVGNGSAILGQNGNPVTGSENAGYIFWNTVSMTHGAASLTWSGLLWRKSTGGPSVAVDLWAGSWSLASPPLAGGYLNTLPAGIYTTQGL